MILKIGITNTVHSKTSVVLNTCSICYWVRKQLRIGNDLIPIINENGFQCLGYQSKLFKKQD